MSDEQGAVEELNPNLAEFEGTEYQDEAWEIVGEVIANDDFLPMDLDVMTSEDLAMDPLFEDYGGIAKDQGGRRWHLPEHLAAKAGQKDEEDEEEEGLIKIKEEELAAAKEEAFQAGLAQGLEEAVSKNAEKFEALEQRWQQVMIDLQQQLGELSEQNQSSCVKFALEVAKKIIGTTVEINPEYIVAIVREAIVQAGTAQIKRIRISPEDMEFVEIIGFEKIVEEHEGSWSFEADPHIKAGCVVDTAAGEIDYQLDAAWERVKDNVMKVIR